MIDIGVVLEKPLRFLGGYRTKASEHVRQEHRYAWGYHAVLNKRRGKITAEDFLANACRFATLCTEVYGQSRLELREKKKEQLRFSSPRQEGGSVVDVQLWTTATFRQIFEQSSLVTLKVTPKYRYDETLHSVAYAKYRNDRPNMIFFYARQGGKFDQRGCDRVLEQHLFQKHFYVSESAPNRDFSVELGLTAFHKAGGWGRD